jgi:dihydroorotate dehydrogenase
VQIYTALAYEGPQAVPNIKEGLVACLKRDGFNSIAEAVGADHRTVKSGDSNLKNMKKKGFLW